MPEVRGGQRGLLLADDARRERGEEVLARWAPAHRESHIWEDVPFVQAKGAWSKSHQVAFLLQVKLDVGSG